MRLASWLQGLSVAVLALSVVIENRAAQAQASIAAENIEDSVVFSYTDASGTPQQSEVTVVRDAREVNQWYYIPAKPELVLTKYGSDYLPQFSLVKYDYGDAADAATISRAGLLQFAARLSLSPEAVTALRSAVSQRLVERGLPASASALRLSALPINSATVSLFSDDGKLIGQAAGTAIAPTFASQHMAFSVPLTDIGTAVFDALVHSQTGIRIAVQFNYNGLTPPGGFKVTVNYKNAFEHYSKEEKFRAQASYYGLFGGNVAYDRASIREALEQSGAMKVEVTDTPNFTADKVDEYLQPILKRINDEILVVNAAPDKINPASASTPSTSGGIFASGGYSVAMKEISKVKQYTETIDFTYQSVVERATVAAGFIGIGNYPESIKAKLITLVDATAPPTVHIAFPPIPDGISRVDLTVGLFARDQQFARRAYIWNSEQSWTDLATGKPVNRVGFSLAGIEQEFGPDGIEDAELRITKTVRSRIDSINLSSRGPASSGVEVIDLEQGISGFRINPSQLPFKQLGSDLLDGKPALVRATIGLTSEGKRKTYSFEAKKIQADWFPPSEEFFLVPNSGTERSAVATINFVFDQPQLNFERKEVLPMQGGLTPLNLDEYFTSSMP